MAHDDAPRELISPIGRVWRGVRHAHNWAQLVRFGLVGASGYVVNLATFALCVSALDVDYRLGAVFAFLVAVSNNFFWNRHWTFRAGGGRAHAQAVRFLVISTAAFLANLGVLALLVSQVGVAELPAQAIAVVVAMPANFTGNKLWTFDA